MRQRAMIAIALSGHPELLIADEPTSALDATLSRRTLELLVELTEQSDAALLIISHDIALCRSSPTAHWWPTKEALVDEGPSDRLHEVAGHPYTLWAAPLRADASQRRDGRAADPRINLRRNRRRRRRGPPGPASSVSA